MSKVYKVKYVDNFGQEQEIELKHFFRRYKHKDLLVRIPPVEKWLRELALEEEDLDYLLAQPYDIYYKVFNRYLIFCSKDLQEDNNSISVEDNETKEENLIKTKTKGKNKMKQKISLIIFLGLIAGPSITGVIIGNIWLTLPAVILSTVLLTVSLFYKGEK